VESGIRKRRFQVRQGAATESGRGLRWWIWVEGGSVVGYEWGDSGLNIVAFLRHTGAASVSAPLTVVSCGVGDEETVVLGNAGC